MKVKEWISWEDADGKPDHVGGLGGWFENGHRWTDYVAAIAEPAVPYAEAIKADVLASGRLFTGSDHQRLPDGVPLFEDGSVGQFSFRAWGDLMAAIATEHDGEDHNYMEFYC